MNIELLIQSIISLIVITAPFDPVKILIFNEAIERPPRPRVLSAARVALNIVLVLGGSAFFGRRFLDLVGINLDAFGIVGGLVVALLGFEMLYGGDPSKTQGGEKREAGPESGDSLLIPLTIPLVAGPGAITTVITLAAHSQVQGLPVYTLIAVGVVALSAFISYAWLGNVIAKARPTTMAIVIRLGGLLLATIGAQMMLSGIKNFFA